jgi:hypothetical protein
MSIDRDADIAPGFQNGLPAAINSLRSIALILAAGGAVINRTSF